jgi:hypothetical protein
MHFNTRDHYRHVVEILARDSGLSEPEVADRVLALSEEKAPIHRNIMLVIISPAKVDRRWIFISWQTPQGSYACGTVSTE